MDTKFSRFVLTETELWKFKQAESIIKIEQNLSPILVCLPITLCMTSLSNIISPLRKLSNVVKFCRFLAKDSKSFLRLYTLIRVHTAQWSGYYNPSRILNNSNACKILGWGEGGPQNILGMLLSGVGIKFYDWAKPWNFV